MKGHKWLLAALAVLCLAAVTLPGCGALCQYRDFASYEELVDWLQANPVSEGLISEYASQWYSKALRLQQDALEDGYIISAAYRYDPEDGTYSVYCIAIINGQIWYWDPETDQPYLDDSLGKVK